MKKDLERKKFDFTPVGQNNFSELQEMFRACFNQLPQKNYFEWKFLQNPAGKAVGFVAHHEGNVAGFYGVIPEYFMVDGEKTLIYQSMDTMTHPDYQRQGLFTGLATKTFEHLIERDGEVFVIGFPGMNSYRGLIKSGWKDIIWINLIFLNRVLFKGRNLFGKTSDISFEKIDKFDHSFKSYFENKTYEKGKILRLLDEEFLNWRLSNNHLFEYKIVKLSRENEIVGFLVYNLLEKQRCFIYHLDFAEDDFYEKYLTDVCRYLFEASGSHVVYTFEHTQPFLNNVFKKKGFIKNPFGKGPFSFRVPFLGFSNREKIKNIEFFRGESYNIEPLLRDY